MSERISADSLITLHYRICNQDGVELAATFNNAPATLQLGAGELAPTLEVFLHDLASGDERSFTLDSGAAYGAHNPQLVQRVGRDQLPPGTVAETDATVQFSSPGGTRFAGRVLQADAATVLIDFNHPLAGQTIRFDVRIVGIL